jgi:hypothetical protein
MASNNIKETAGVTYPSTKLASTEAKLSNPCVLLHQLAIYQFVIMLTPPCIKYICLCLLVCLFVCLFVCLMVFNATFNNISAILWRSVLLVEETGVPGENH